MATREQPARVLRLVPRGASRADEEPIRPKSPALDDAQILAAVRAGDRSAATALHTRVRPQIDATIGRLLGRRDPDHEDLGQLALIALVSSLERYRGDCSLDTWTSRITAHTVFKEMRRRRVARGVFQPAEDVESERSPANLERDADMRSVLRRVRGHLDAMDPVKAWTVVLHDVCGHDLREIAEITECSIAAAQSRLVRGRGELHARLEGDPELAEELERTEVRR